MDEHTIRTMRADIIVFLVSFATLVGAAIAFFSLLSILLALQLG